MTNSPKPTFSKANVRAAYQLRYHFGWYTKGRRPTFANNALHSKLESKMQELATSANYHLLGLDVEPYVVRCLLSLQPTDSPESVTRKFKGNLAASLRSDGVQNLWSRGWFVRSNGSVTDDIIRAYIDNQAEHHRAAPIRNPSIMEKSRHHLSADVDEIRKSSHAAFQYNVHFVFSVRNHFDFLDPTLEHKLIQFWLAVCQRKGWIGWNIEVVWNHVHLLIGLTPGVSPEEAALSLLNNAEYWFFERYRAVMLMDGLDSVFQAGYYTGTCGAATTAQIKRYLDSQVDPD